jgi:hypothetical protein
MIVYIFVSKYCAVAGINIVKNLIYCSIMILLYTSMFFYSLSAMGVL